MTDRRKTVLVTGAGVEGIGGALCREFNSKGYRVFAAARRLETIKELVELGCEPIHLDVTSQEQILRVRDAISEKTGGKLDILVNNAYLTLLIQFKNTVY
jgi:1-acylglycerone phosphate reductase